MSISLDNSSHLEEKTLTYTMLNILQQQQATVLIYLKNGVGLKGKILSYDKTCIIFENGSVVWMSSIATIQTTQTSSHDEASDKSDKA